MTPLRPRLALVWTLAGAACVGLLVACSLASASASRRPTCERSGSRTVLETPGVRVFRVTRRTHGVTYRPLLGCLKKTGRTTALDDPNPEFDPEHAERVTVAGRFVARALVSDRFSAEATVDVATTNLRTGRGPEDSSFAESAPGGIDERVTGLVLNRHGTSAWIAFNASDDPPAYQLWTRRIDADGPTKLDESSGLKPRSLALSADGATIYWRRGDETRSASLK